MKRNTKNSTTTQRRPASRTEDAYQQAVTRMYNDPAWNETYALLRGDEVRRIARDVLGVPTLERRNRDQLDFHEIGVWQIQKALQDAYAAGHAAGLQQGHAIVTKVTPA